MSSSGNDSTISQEKLDIVLTDCYDFHGRDKKTGIPTRASLKNLS